MFGALGSSWGCSWDVLRALWGRFVAEALKHYILRGLKRPGLQNHCVLRGFRENVVFYVVWSVQSRQNTVLNKVLRMRKKTLQNAKQRKMHAFRGLSAAQP